MNNESTIRLSAVLVLSAAMLACGAKPEQVLKQPALDVYQWSTAETQVEDGKWLKLSGGALYRGGLKGGRPSGKGQLKFSDGRRYTGEFVNGTMQGNGVMKHRDGRQYEGEFFEDQPHGQGILAEANGQRFQGRFENGIFSEGKVTRIDGVVLEGRLHGNNFTGTRTDPDGLKTTGVFASGKLQDGLSTVTYPSGDSISAFFVNGVPDGMGVKTQQRASGEALELLTLWREGVVISAGPKPPNTSKSCLMSPDAEMASLTPCSADSPPDGFGSLQPGAPGVTHLGQFTGGRLVRGAVVYLDRNGAYRATQGNWVSGPVSGIGFQVAQPKGGPASLLYQGSFQKGKYHGKGLCGGTEPCEHHQGHRVDQKHLKAQLETKLSKASGDLSSRLSELKQANRRKLERLEERFERKIDNIHEEIAYQETVLSTFIALAGQNENADSRAKARDAERKLRNLRDEKDDLEREAERTIRKRRREWNSYLERESLEAQEEADELRQRSIREARQFCDGLPGRRFNQQSLLCEYG